MSDPILNYRFVIFLPNFIISFTTLGSGLFTGFIEVKVVWFYFHLTFTTFTNVKRVGQYHHRLPAQKQGLADP